jgi:hypothetical protein
MTKRVLRYLHFMVLNVPFLFLKHEKYKLSYW